MLTEAEVREIEVESKEALEGQHVPVDEQFTQRVAQLSMYALKAASNTIPRILTAYRQLQAERDRLRAAVEKYGQHEAMCDVHRRTPEQIEKIQWPKCTCGLNAAKEGRDG